MSVSVIMAAHNAAPTIAQAIMSIQHQSLTDWELIVVDDGSSDETAEIASHFAREDQRIKVLTNPLPQGSGASRNRAIEQATSELVSVLDADDIATPERLAEQVSYMRTNNVVAVASQLAEFGDWGGPQISYWPTTPAGIARRRRKRQMPLPHPSCTFRRDAVLAVGGYDEVCRRSQDLALMLRLGDQPVACLPAVHVLYRTSRPVSLRYVVESERWAALARLRNLPPRSRASRLSPPRRTFVDLRSILSWLKRRTQESRAGMAAPAASSLRD